MCAELELRRRKVRARSLPRELLGDPAWSMLLDMFVRKHRGQKTSTARACRAAIVPQATALRWLAVLESQGLVLLTADAGRGGARFVTLTSKAHRALSAILGTGLP